MSVLTLPSISRVHTASATELITSTGSSEFLFLRSKLDVILCSCASVALHELD